MSTRFTRAGARVDALLTRSRALQWVYDDGGRAHAGLPIPRGLGDCVARAIAIATTTPYLYVRDDLDRRMAQDWDDDPPLNYRSDYGVPRPIYERYLLDLGWRWIPLMGIGTGCRYHLAIGEIPSHIAIAKVSKHLCAVIGDTVRDTHDPTRNGSRCVYGLYVPPGA